ncbi:LPXTG cell wall anchor domain-containing protein [Lacticaseibacillus zeae]|nr:LPXTG cell wall anchor domain-containing protein [Lacticaseibacillus zeae]
MSSSANTSTSGSLSTSGSMSTSVSGAYNPSMHKQLPQTSDDAGASSVASIGMLLLTLTALMALKKKKRHDGAR